MVLRLQSCMIMSTPSKGLSLERREAKAARYFVLVGVVELSD